MAAKTPSTISISWPGFIFQLLLLGMLYVGFDKINAPEPFVFAALTYGLAAAILRRSFAASHRKGMALVRKQQFEAAIPYFAQSVAYFTQRQAIDRFRWATLLSASGIGYREMGLCNLAFCYSQTGNGAEAIRYYKEALLLNPVNGLALAGLKMLEAGKNG